MAGVQLHELEKIYPGGKHAVRRVNLNIGDGELLVLVGPSGCGKSTVLRMIAGLEDITAGEIRIGDRVVNGLSPQQRNIAMVFQDYALYPHKTVRKNLEFPLRMMSQPKAQRSRRVEEVARRLDLTAVLDHKPKQLSGGQRQRVAMGRAMVREPEVFLLDEPLSNLDAKLRVQIRSEIAQLQRQLGTTMVYVTHDQVEAMTLGHRVAVMLDGKLQQVAAGQELYDQPANVFVARFIGSPAMNVFESRICQQCGMPCAVFGDTAIPLPQSLQTAARRLENQTVYLGLRPEAFTLADAPRPPAQSGGTDHVPETAWPDFHAKVVTVEALGHENIVLLESPQPLYREEETSAADGQTQDDGQSQQAAGAGAGPAAPDRAVMMVRLPAGLHAAVPGERLHLAINPAAAYLFGPDGERAVPSG